MFSAMSARLSGLTGWRRLLVAAVAGGLAVLALPPVHLIPVLLIALPVQLWLLDGAQRCRTAFAIGWAFGLGFFAGGLYWIGNAFVVGAPGLVWASPLIIGGLAAILAVYHGMAALLLHASRTRGVARVAVFAALWTLFEMARGWLFTGFPWNPIGSVWMPVDGMVQTTAWFGVFGLGLFTVLVMAMPAVLGWPGRRRGLTVGLAVAGAVALMAAGQARLPSGPDATVPDVLLRLVQPNIPQSLKWRRDLGSAHLRTYIDLSQDKPGGPSATHMIWGETAVPFSLDGQDHTVEDLISSALLAGRQGPVPGAVITGAVRRTPVGTSPFQVWNSLIAIDAAGQVRASYDKSHLVPFGEYVPLRGLLPITKLTAGGTDFTPGPGAVTIDMPGLPPVGALICYEVIFPGAVASRDHRPAWLLNITNDGWYGVSSGPYQHLAAARLRAVEEGLPLVRVANTGTSAIFDGHGRAVVEIPLDTAGAVDGPLPVALSPTVFARLGNALPLGLAILLLVGGLVAGRFRRAP